MDQVSRPVLIALGATVVLLVVWLAALRPKPVSVSNTPLAPTKVIPKAKAAAAAADAATAKTQATVGETPVAAATPAAPAATAATPATAAPAAKPAAALPRLDGPVLRDIRAGKVVVMLFWNAKGADDIATRGVIRDLDRHDGKVAVHIVPISRVGRYPAITEGAKITQSPTTLVIDRKRRTRVIAGLSEERELSQAVGDALAGR
ncbi:MAG TPA: hypothetical protein VMY78_05300 [Solirubrobacteraceae bacterium]|nr:hypothetical protein [Solirubrobacteraceae bacterium]